MFNISSIQRRSLVMAIAGSALAFVPSTPSEAKLFRLNAEETALPRLAGYEAVEALPAPHAAVCCPDYCVTYRAHHRLKKICCDCGESQNVVLEVADPLRCGCHVEVPLCIPGCCEGAPCVDEHCGLLGRGYVTYEWKCGYKVKVAFLVHQPTVVVHSYGR